MRSIGLLLLAGVVSALIGIGATGLRDHFTPPPELMSGGANADGETLAKIEAANSLARLKNMSLVGAIYGAALCLLSGAAAGIAARGRPLAGAGLGLLLGTLLGGLGGMLDVKVFHQMRVPDQDAFAATAVSHAALWICVGLAFAATVRVAARRKVLGQLVIVAVLCGGIAGALFPILCAVLFPMANPDQPMPIGTSAAGAWFVLPSLLLTLAAGRILAHPPAQAASATSEGEPAAS